MSESFKKIEFFTVMLLPIAVVVGNFATNLIISSIILFFIINFFRNNLVFNKYFSKITLFILIILALNLFFSVDRILSLKGIIGLIKNFLLFVSLTYFFKKSPNNFRKFIVVIFYLVLFVTFDTLIQYFYGKDIFGFEIQKSHGFRLSGPFGSEYVVGAFLSKLLFISIFYFEDFFRLNKNLIILPYIIFIFLIIFLTKERAAFYLTAIAIILFFLFKYKSSKIKLTSFFLTGLIPFVFFMNYNGSTNIISLGKSDLNNFSKDIYDDKIYMAKIKYVIEPIYYLGVKNNSYINKHFTEDYIIKNKNNTILDTRHGAHFLTAFEIFKENYLIGSGIKTFRVECSKEKYSKINSKSARIRCNTHPHQLFLEILSEGGIFLFLTFVCFLVYLIFKIKSNNNLTKNSKTFLYLLLIVLFLPIQTSGSFFSTFNGLFYFMAFAVIFFKLNIKLISESK